VVCDCTRPVTSGSLSGSATGVTWIVTVPALDAPPALLSV
jgi:hypothetical protein